MLVGNDKELGFKSSFSRKPLENYNGRGKALATISEQSPWHLGVGETLGIKNGDQEQRAMTFGVIQEGDGGAWMG